MMSAYEASRLVQAIRMHFTSDYDFFKYKGSLRPPSQATIDKFNASKARFLYGKVGRHADPQGLVVANLLHDVRMFVADMTGDAGERRYDDWRRSIAQAVYKFDRAIGGLESIAQLESIGPSGLPWVLEAYIGERWSAESVIVLDRFSGCLDRWARLDHPLATGEVFKLRKYRGFFSFDEQKAKAILRALASP